MLLNAWIFLTGLHFLTVLDDVFTHHLLSKAISEYQMRGNIFEPNPISDYSAIMR